MLSPDGEQHELLRIAQEHACRIVDNNIPEDNRLPNHLLVYHLCDPPLLVQPINRVEDLVVVVDNKGKRHLVERHRATMAIYKRLLTKDEVVALLKYF